MFISHASAEFGEAKAPKDWLVQQDPPPANDILLDADMVLRSAHLDTSFFLLGSGGGSTKQIEIALSQGADLKSN
jgi:hypothetical protein